MQVKQAERKTIKRAIIRLRAQSLKAERLTKTEKSGAGAGVGCILGWGG